MGSSAESKFNKDLWPIVYQGPFYNVLKNIKTSQEIQEYRQSFTDQDVFQRAKIIYDQRQNTPKNVVSFLGWEYFTDRRGACATFKAAKVYTERIPIRLEQVHNIPQEDCIFYMCEAMKGFSNIYDKSGDYVDLTDTMIGFNKDEDVRVWINQDFSKNYPSIQNHRLRGQNNEHRMVQKNFDVFQKHLQGKKWSKNFISYKQESLKKPYTFEETISFLEFYIQKISQFNLNNNSQQVNEDKQMTRSIQQIFPRQQMQARFYPNPLLMQSQTIPPNYYNRNIPNNRVQQQENYSYHVSDSLIINQPINNNIQQTKIKEPPFKKFQTTELIYNVNRQRPRNQFKQKDNKVLKSNAFNLKSKNLVNPNQKVPHQTQILKVTLSYQQPYQINSDQHRPKKISKMDLNQNKVNQRENPQQRQEVKISSSYQQNYAPKITNNLIQNYYPQQSQKKQYQPNYLNSKQKTKQNQFNLKSNNFGTNKFNKQPLILPPSQPFQISNQLRINGNQPMKIGENQQMAGIQQIGFSHQNSKKMTGLFPNQQMTGEFGQFPINQQINDGTDKFHNQHISMSRNYQIPSQQMTIGVNQNKQQGTEGYHQQIKIKQFNKDTFNGMSNRFGNQNKNFLVPHPSATKSIFHIGGNKY